MQFCQFEQHWVNTNVVHYNNIPICRDCVERLGLTLVIAKEVMIEAGWMTE